MLRFAEHSRMMSNRDLMLCHRGCSPLLLSTNVGMQDDDVVHYLQASGQEDSVGLWLNARAWAQDAVQTATKSLQDNVIRPLTAKQRQEPFQDSSMVRLVCASLIPGSADHVVCTKRSREPN